MAPVPVELPFDSLLLVSFGGPEAREDVIPFLESVLRGRPVPRQRMLEVAEHYYHFGGRSPINDQNRALLRALAAEPGMTLPLYWGNRNWQPLLVDALREMAAHGRRRALAFITSAFSAWSGCRQYLEDIERARAEIGPDAPVVERLRPFYNHPLFIAAVADRVGEAFAQLPVERRATAHLLFTAHSIPVAMAETSDYVRQIEEAASLVAARLGRDDFHIVYQSRSGAPGQPWLEPDIVEALGALAGAKDVVVMPIGFVSDHMEVLYDLDTEASQAAGKLGLNLLRAGTPGTHPQFVSMIMELIRERTGGWERRAMGRYGPSADVCRKDCCLRPGK
jgi:protoporphyrin/coproporphyrin ferrochelatase